MVNKHANIYKNTLDQKLKTLKNHRVVALFDSISKKYNFSYYKPVEWILQHSDFPDLKKTKNKLDENDETITKGKEYLLDEFKKELIKFNKDSLFQKYLKGIKPINEKVIETVLESKSIKFLPDYLEDYYGTKLSSYNLIISPLLHSGGFNSEIINEKGEREVYAIIGPNGEINFYPHFDKDYLEMDMILHEFGHSFVNPLTDKYVNQIENLKNKYYNEKLQKNGKNQGYSKWKYVFNELALGLINGATTGLVTGLVLYVKYHNVFLALIIFIAMIGNLAIAGFFGFIIPLILKRFDLDPAVSSSIFLTTATDVGGFFIFLGLAKMFLPYLL